jgi:hypothetical protein
MSNFVTLEKVVLTIVEIKCPFSARNMKVDVACVE